MMYQPVHGVQEHDVWMQRLIFVDEWWLRWKNLTWLFMMYKRTACFGFGYRDHLILRQPFLKDIKSLTRQSTTMWYTLPYIRMVILIIGV